MLTYPQKLDNVLFKHHVIRKRSGKLRHVFAFDSRANGFELEGVYNYYSRELKMHMMQHIPGPIRVRTAYNKGVSIPMIIKNLEGSKVFLQTDIVDFFNCCDLGYMDRLIPNNYYYDPANKVGIKQGTNISGDITNLFMLSFDKEMLNMNRRYARYSDDIIMGFDTVAEAEQALELIVNKLEAKGLTINRRKTMITDLSESGDRYVKYLGYSIKLDKLQPGKLRITMSRKKRNKWWAKGQIRHANDKIDGGGMTCMSI